MAYMMKFNAKTKFFVLVAASLCNAGVSVALHAEPPQSASCPSRTFDQHLMEQPSSGFGTNANAENTMKHGDIAQFAEAQCSNCHGLNGVSINDKIPNLAGQRPMYLCRWLAGCREQGDKCEDHEDIAATLTDQQILDLSKFYANLPSNKW
jgi:cytochrome c553